VLAVAGPAGAVGPPPSAVQDEHGVVSPVGDVRFVALARGGGTLVRAVRIADGRVLGARLVRGRLGIPVAAGAVRTGLSGDGRTLVLGELLDRATRPGARTTIAAVSTDLRATARRFSLPGVFTVDAVSPDARWVYLIQRRGGDAFDYAVRAFDLRRGRLLPGVIVDKREPGPMHGYPVDRAMANGGRLALTLYAGLGEHSFVHALDTVHRSARCLDLPPGIGDDAVWRLRLRTGGDGRLLVTDRRTPVAAIDLATLRISRVGAR
jgi:hypothetical protein